MSASVAVPNLLTNCAAMVVAHDRAGSATLISMGHKVGFGAVGDSSNFVNDWNVHKLLFVLVHYDLGNDAKQQLLDSIRHAGSTDVSFAPVILFLPDGPFDEILQYIEMGFDDVICLPEKSHVLATRLGKQVGQEHTYIETRTYLGPDRRRMELSGHNPAAHTRTGDRDHTNLTVLRSPDQGVQILRRQLVVKAR